MTKISRAFDDVWHGLISSCCLTTLREGCYTRLHTHNIELVGSSSARYPAFAKLRIDRESMFPLLSNEYWGSHIPFDQAINKRFFVAMAPK